MSLEGDIAKIREIANRIGIVGGAAPITGETPLPSGRCGTGGR
jgi:hypothetical protein